MTIVLIALFIFACFLLLFSFPRVGMWFLIFLSIVQPAYFYRWNIANIPRFWAWFPFFIAALLVFPFLTNSVGRKYIFFKPNLPLGKIYIFLFLILSTGIFSCYLNHVPLTIGIFGLRYSILLVLIASFMYFFKPLNLEIESFIRFIVYVGIIQVPFAVLQRFLFTFFGININIDSKDLISGTFSTYATLGFIQALAICLVVAYWFRTYKAIIGKSVLFLITFLSLPLFVSNSRAIFLFLFILLGIVAIRYQKILKIRFFHYVIYVVLTLLIILLGMMFIFSNLQMRDYGRDLKKEYTIDYIIEYNLKPTVPIYYYLKQQRDPRMGRLRSIAVTFDLIRKEFITLIFGLAPGNTQESQFLGKNGKYFQEYGSLSGLNRTQISFVLSELGFMGIFIYILFFMLLSKNIHKMKAQNLVKYLLTSDVYFFIVLVIILFSIYSQILADYAVILCISYFIAVLQRQNTQMET